MKKIVFIFMLFISQSIFASSVEDKYTENVKKALNACVIMTKAKLNPIREKLDTLEVSYNDVYDMSMFKCILHNEEDSYLAKRYIDRVIDDHIEIQKKAEASWAARNKKKK